MDLVTDPEEIAAAQRRLAIAMLRQTAADIAGGATEDGITAWQWVLRDDDEQPGFIWCCHTLGLRHTLVRDRLVDGAARIAYLLTRLTETMSKREDA